MEITTTTQGVTVDGSGFLTTQQQTTPAVMAASVKETVAQEVQVAAVLAKRFPRDENAAQAKITIACKRPAFAQTAEYVYNRGGSQIVGPTIKLAQLIKAYWGNITSGWRVVEQTDDETTCLAYAWDVETNVRKERIFKVKHVRKANNTFVRIVDPRDLLEYISSQASRHERECIFELIPQDVIDDAVSTCRKALKASFGDENARDATVKALISAFAAYGVMPADIEERIGHNLKSITDREIVDLRRVYTSLREEYGTPADHFKSLRTSTPAADKDSGKDEIKAAIKKRKKGGGRDAEDAPEELPEPLMPLGAPTPDDPFKSDGQ